MKALRTILFLALLCFGSRAYGSAMTTLTNFNAAYFLVDADPTAIPTNVVLLSGNITNWQKLSTNVTITINPTDTYVPYRIDASTFGDSWWYRSPGGMGIRTNIFFGPGESNYLRRVGNELQYLTSGTSVVRIDPAGGISIGPNTYAPFSHASGGETLLSQRVVTSGDPNWNQIHIDTQIIDPILGTSLGEFDVDTTTNEVFFTIDAQKAGGENRGIFGDISDAAGLFRFTRTTNRIESLDDGLGNYSYTDISQFDTNSVLAINMQTGGTAGQPRGFEFQTNGVRSFHIPGTSWDDSQVPEAMVRVGATAPTLGNFNGGPAQTLQFQNNRDDTIMATAQMTHRWKQGTDIHPHVHWCETAATGAGTNIVWQLTYTWTNIGCAYPAYTTVSITNSITGTNWLSQLSEFPPISGTGKLVSSIFVFELKRLANTATADDYNQSVAFLGFDLHHQVDSPGSDSELTKSF